MDKKKGCRKLYNKAWKNAFGTFFIFVTYNGLITKLYDQLKKTTDSEPLWFLLSNFS